MSTSKSKKSRDLPNAVTIISLGRFHVADLARELARLGCKITFISDVPHSRLNRFGLQNFYKITAWPATFFTLLSRMLATRLDRINRLSWARYAADYYKAILTEVIE